MIVLASCIDGLYRVELGADADDDILLDRNPDSTLPPRPRPVAALPPWLSALLVDVDARGSTVVAVVDRRPPLLVSHDGGATFTESGGGLPKGRAVVLGEAPDDVLYAARNRLYLSRDGGRFWRAVGAELPEILDIAWE